MKTYKLIKTYPGSFPLGHLAILDESVKYYNLGTTTRSLDYIENHPEHWQEVCPDCLENINTCRIFPCKKKDYKILSLITNNKTILNSPFFSVKDLLKNQGCNIHSIKRLSDGEVFTVGDKVQNGKITEFRLINNILIPKIGKKVYLTINLEKLEKAKQPLFTTEDGVDIFENDNFYSTRKDCLGNIIKYKGNPFEITSTKCKEFVDFSTKEKAEEYILMNKPCLSLQEIKNVFEKDVLLTTPKLKVVRTLEKIVKQKLK